MIQTEVIDRKNQKEKAIDIDTYMLILPAMLLEKNVFAQKETER